MAFFGSTHKNASFEEWYEELQRVAESYGGSVDDRDAWREDYDVGKTPIDSWLDEWEETADL